MDGSAAWCVVGIDNGGTSNNATIVDADGRMLVERLVEEPSRVLEGPAVAIEAMATSYEKVLDAYGMDPGAVRAVGLDTPGPASAVGVISSKGSTNFSAPEWRGFDVRGALEARLGLPVVYSNDGNAAAVYAHHVLFGADAAARNSVAAIVGTGLGGGLVVGGRAVAGAAGMAGEVGHVHIPMEGLLAEGQPVPVCNCGQPADAESVASLTGITLNLLPYWLSTQPDHPLASVPSIVDAAKQVRSYAERGDTLALRIFEQQAMAIGRMFTIVANIADPDAYVVGGGVVEAAPHFREWFLGTVRTHTQLREEQVRVTRFAVVPDGDMAGARGAALAARDAVLATALPAPAPAAAPVAAP